MLSPGGDGTHILGWRASVAGGLLGALLGLLWVQPDLTYLFSLPGDLQEVWAEIVQRHWPLAVPPRHSVILLLSAVWGAGLCLGSAGALAGSRFAAPLGLAPILAAGSFVVAAGYAGLWLHRGIAAAGGLAAVVVTGAPATAYLLGRCLDAPTIRLGRSTRRRRVTVGVLALTSIALLGAPAMRPLGAGSPSKPAQPSRVLFIGIDAADWAFLGPAIRLGHAPTLARWVAEGSSGELQSTSPVLSPPVWTTMVTGREPAVHGIEGFTRNGRRYTSADRRAFALWEILPRHGLTTATLFWWASWPAERVPGLIVTDRLLEPGLPSRVHPARLTDSLVALANEALARATNLPVAIEQGALGDPDRARAFEVVKELIDRDRVVARLTVEALEHRDDALVATYFRSLDGAGHKFWREHLRYLKPGLARVLYGPATGPEPRAGRLLLETVRGVDDLLGDLERAAGPDVNMLVASDHGMTATVPRIDTNSTVPETGNHRRIGVILLRGPDIRSGQRLGGATVYDVAPTLLHLSGLPIPEDLPGRVLVEALRPGGRLSTPVARTPALGPRPRPPGNPIDAAPETRLLEQLRELGYILE